jgi:FSR family fosmidomycin resistance protein-like MFS transporter
MRIAQTIDAQPSTAPANSMFQAGEVLTIAGDHLIHDVFTSFLPPLLPKIIERLGLSLALAGSLSAFQQFPALINPLLGLLADRGSLRWFAILAPTITAMTMSVIGLAPSYTVLVILLLVSGISTAAWHVPTPVMVARASGRRVGQGMSFFMLGGELARTLGPLLAVAAVSWWGIEGAYRLIPLGVAASAVLYWRIGDVNTPANHLNGSWAETWQELRQVMLPIAGIIAAQGFMSAALSTFLPTFLASEGASLWRAGSAFSVMELAAAIGAFTSGTISDRVGRRQVLGFVLLAAPVLMVVFLAARGWAIFPALAILGLVIFSTNPVLMALVQEYGRHHPATANGPYMATGFVGRSIIIIVVGAMADRWGLRATFQLSAFLGMAGLPFVLLLPKRPASQTFASYQDTHV